MFDIYFYDADNGELSGIERNVAEEHYKAMAAKFHFDLGYLVKVVDQYDGVIFYTLG
jgi:hypothetical protein